jgi:hypothetical protein
MLYPVRSVLFGKRQVSLDVSGMNDPKLLIDGNPAPQAKKNNQFIVKDDKGVEILVELKTNNFFDSVPAVIVNGSTIKVTNDLAWYEYVAIASPLILVGLGGAIGGGIGGAAVFVNRSVMRSEMDPALRYLVTFGMAIASFLLWLIVASSLRSAMGR